MKIATKFALAFFVCSALSVFLYSAVAASRETRRLEDTVAGDLASLGRTLGVLTLAVWENEGEVQARELVGYTDREEGYDVRWTWLDEAPHSAHAPLADPQVVTRIRQGEAARWVRIKPDGSRKVLTYVPLLRPNARPAALELSRPIEARSQIFWTELREQLDASMLVAAVATILAMALTSWIVARPLATVTAQARRIGAGDLSTRLPVRGADEISTLVGALNGMCDQLHEAQTRADAEASKRLTALEQLRHTDRLRTVGTLASGIAHELGTPLNVISLRAKMLANGELPISEGPATATIIAGQADRVTKIVRQLLDFARRRTPNRADTGIGDVVERVSTLLATLAKSANVRISVRRDDPDVRAHLDAAQIEQAVTNLVINAIHAMPDGGRIDITTGHARAQRPGAEAAEVACAFIEIKDEGQGISREHLDRIFEPFFTTKAVGEGTGLGLSVTHGIVEDHGGWMVASSELGHGTTFALYLPIGPVD